jgi:glycine oxidase
VEDPPRQRNQRATGQTLRDTALGWKVIARESGATGLRGRLRAADRRNLIRVMPAKGALMSSPAPAGPSGQTDALVIGGGVIGLAIAWRAAQRGLRVTVADPAPAAGATHAAAGMLTPVAEAAYAERELFGLGRASLDRYPAFTAELTGLTGLPTGFAPTGTLQVAYDGDDLAMLIEQHRLQESFGRAATRLTARECREAEPMLDPAVRGGLLAAGDGSVDPRLLAAALLAAAGQAGVRVVRQRATEIILTGSGTTGSGTTGSGTTGSGTTGSGTTGSGTAGAAAAAGAVLADGSTVRARWVVLAAGWQSAVIGGLPPGTAPPVRPVKGQILRLRPRPGAGRPGAGRPEAGRPEAGRPGAGRPGAGRPGAGEPGAGGREAGRPGAGEPGTALLTRTVRGLVRGSSVYLVPRADGEIVVGATQEELGADTTVTAGGVWELLRDARLLVPGITELELAEAVAGLRPGTPDNAPVLGPAALPGLVLATGHFRGGVLLAPVTAEVIAEYLATERVPELARPFTVARFSDEHEGAGRGHRH